MWNPLSILHLQEPAHKLLASGDAATGSVCLSEFVRREGPSVKTIFQVGSGAFCAFDLYQTESIDLAIAEFNRRLTVPS